MLRATRISNLQSKFVSKRFSSNDHHNSDNKIERQLDHYR